MENKIEISFVVVSYNCSEVIGKCVESLLTHAPGQQYIIIDNASKDGTAEILNGFKGNVELVINTTNTGFTKACNQGINMAKGEYVFLLNPDAYLSENTVGELMSFFKTHPDAGAVAPLLYYPDERVQNYIRTFPTISGIFVESFLPMKSWNKFAAYRNYTCDDLNLKESQKVEQPAGAALLFRNDIKLDENYFIYGSDVELCQNIYDRGTPIYLVSSAKVYHYQSQGGTGDDYNPRLKMYLQLDSYYGYSRYFKLHRSKLYYSSYRMIFSGALFAVAFISLFKMNAAVAKLKWKRFRLFVKHQNFTGYLK